MECEILTKLQRENDTLIARNLQLEPIVKAQAELIAQLTLQLKYKPQPKLLMSVRRDGHSMRIYENNKYKQVRQVRAALAEFLKIEAARP